MMVSGDFEYAYELYVLTVTCHSIDATLGRYSECIPHVLSSLLDCCFVFMCVCVGRIHGDLSHIGYVIFGHDVAFILC